MANQTNPTPATTAFTFNTARAEAEEQKKIGLHEQNAHIKAQSVVLSKTKPDGSGGNPMINLRWEILDGADMGKVVFDRLIFAPSRYPIERLEQFCAAIGRDAATEFGDTPLDLAFVSDWAESLIGEQATIKLGLDKGSTGDDGTVYEPKPEVKKYLPVGSAKSANDLIDLD